jgi:DnaK suppressor protein
MTPAKSATVPKANASKARSGDATKAAKSPAKAVKTPAKTPAKTPVKTLAKTPAKTPAKPAAKPAAKVVKPAAKVAKAPAKTAKAPVKAVKPPVKAKAAAKPVKAPAAAATKVLKAPAKPPAGAATSNGASRPKTPKRPSVGPYAKEAKFLEEQQGLLLIERAIYQGQAVDLKAEADSLAQEREPGDVQFDEESGEGGTITVDRERDLALSAQALLAVEEIDLAMGRLVTKAYGACERCHQPIPKTRLRALPYARLCVACKSGGLSRR